MIIVIDGPAGSGKSSTARALANRLDIQFLDSGALYRAVTVLWIRSGKPDLDQFFHMLPDVDIQTEYRNQTFFVSVDNTDVTEEIRSQPVADAVSKVAAHPGVRMFVNRYMRNLVKEGVYVADGRDLGTAVFPGADLKFFMDASLEERSKRRFREMEQAGHDVTFREVKRNLEERDRRDRNRSADPLKKADDAIVVDTTGKTFEGQINEMIAIIEKKLKLKS